MRDDVIKLWPEIEWIQDPDLREKVTQVWVAALEQSPLTPEDLERIPFTLLAPGLHRLVHGPQALGGAHLQAGRPDDEGASTATRCPSTWTR